MKGIRPGHVIQERWEILKAIGSGSAAQIFLAKDRIQDQRVVLKIVGAQGEEDLRWTLKQEFSTLTRLQHPNLPKVSDLIFEDEHWILGVEWIDGENIEEAGNKSNLSSLMDWLVQGLRALDHLHHHGLLHLDIKPENLLIPDPGPRSSHGLKLIDFGLSQWDDQHAGEGFSGTLPYVAPEILLGKQATVASDLYSYGMLLWKMLSGSFPFRSQDPQKIFQEQLYAHKMECPRLNSALPDSLGDFLKDCVAKNPEQRPQSAAALLKGLSQHLEEAFEIRPPRIPLKVLEEMDYIFHEPLLEQIIETLVSGETDTYYLTGPEGVGKSFLMEQVRVRLSLQGFHPVIPRKITKEAIGVGTHLLADQGLSGPINNKRKLPSLVVASQENCPPTSFKLAPLNLHDLTNFIQKRVVEFPKAHIPDLLQMTQGIPKALSRWLQDCRDLSWIRWELGGWTWRAPQGQGPFNVPPASQNLWERRLHRIQKILSAFPEGLEAGDLAGMMELDMATLSPWLKDWEVRNILRRTDATHQNKWKLMASKDQKDKSVPAARDWDWLALELKKLYLDQQYPLALQWMENWQEKDHPPENIRIWGARHLVSLGRHSQALAYLPSEAPANSSDCGLFHEIQTRAYLGLGKGDSGLSHCQQAMVAYEKAQDDGGIARIHQIRALMAKRKEGWSTAKDLLKRAQAASRKAGDTLLQCTTLMNLGNGYFDHGYLLEAQQAYEEALAMISGTDHPYFQSVLQHNWVNFLFYSGNINQAQKSTYTWLEHAIQFGFIEQQAAAFNYLGLTQGAKGHHQEEGRCFKEAIHLLKGLGSLRSAHLLPQILINRGHGYLSQKKYLPAQLDAEKALGFATDLKHFQLMAQGLLCLAQIFRLRPRPQMETSQGYLSQADQLVRDYQLRPLLWELEFERGQQFLSQNNVPLAQKALLKAQQALQLNMASMAPPYRKYFLRDGKDKKIRKALEVS